jgi:hypothetical protein
MQETGAGWAQGDVFQESYESVVNILRRNPLTSIPSEMLLVGRVFGLLNGLSMTLQAKTNMLLAFAQLARRSSAARRRRLRRARRVRRLLEA